MDRGDEVSDNDENRPPNLGPTRRFPRGPLNASDEGEIRFAVSVRDGLVNVEFGSPVAWLGLPPDIARQFAAILVRNAARIDGQEP